MTNKRDHRGRGKQVTALARCHESLCFGETLKGLVPCHILLILLSGFYVSSALNFSFLGCVWL